MIHHEIGSPITIDQSTFVQTEKGEMGYAFFGPYELYQPGVYSVTFHVVPDAVDPQDGSICGWVDVAVAVGTNILEKTNLFIDRLVRENGKIVLHFLLTEAAELEFRVYSTGKARLKVWTGMAAVPIPEIGYCPVLGQGAEAPANDGFFRQNFHIFRWIYENGGRLRHTAEGTIVSFGGVDFYIRSTETFEVVKEIFFYNEYNCHLDRNLLAIDIGMNVGLTSLYMAREPRVVEVHGFEPFRTPFRQALENFSLNSAFSKKIHPHNIGIGGADAEFSVLSDPNVSISTSIRGLKTGEPEKITIQDAVKALGPLLLRAKENGLEIVLKMDCEGSEFAILESMVSAGIINDIRVLMIEWHKWWSAEKSQSDIVEPLKGRGFVVFDRTMPANPHAGMLYAVQTGSPTAPIRKPSRLRSFLPWGR